MTEHNEFVSIANLANGGAVELIDIALAKVWENIKDPDTDAETKRSVTVTLTMTPDEDREFVKVGVQCQPKLAAPRGVVAKVSVGKIDGAVFATEYHSPQTEIETYIDGRSNVTKLGVSK